MKNIPGPKSKQGFDKEQEFMAAGLQSIALFSQIVVQSARGVRITDIDGNTFLDFTAGIGVGSVGHCHPKYVEIMTQQLQSVTFGSFSTENRAEFLRLFASLTPGNLKSIQLFSGGAEAVEAAFRLAKSGRSNGRRHRCGSATAFSRRNRPKRN